MPPGRLARLRDFNYTGIHRYHVRAGTWNRAKHFEDEAIVRLVRDQLVQFAPEHGFAVDAYCFMPDHAHLLLAGTSEHAVLTMFVAAWKQRTGYEFARRARRAGIHSTRLWQPTYFDRVLRDDEASSTAALYIMGNPVRAGLTAAVGGYPHAWCRYQLE